jgi:pimeloyl-ACP methyl ester carboxylesterase
MTVSPLPESHFVERAGVRLHHLDWGNPRLPTLVLVHGIRLHAHVWSHFARVFRDRYHILALDQRGHGDSDWSPDGHYHLHEYYEDLHAVLVDRGVQNAVLVGHSLGARVSMLYTHLHPGSVSRLVLVDMAAGLPVTAPGTDFSRVTETPPPKDFASPQEAVDYLGAILKLAPKEMIEESVIFGLRQKPDGRHTWKYDPALGGRPQPRPGLREWDLWEVVRTIRCPALLLRGELSRVVSPEIAERMSQEMPDRRVERIDRAGHALFTDQPEAFALSVGRFLGK